MGRGERSLGADPARESPLQACRQGGGLWQPRLPVPRGGQQPALRLLTVGSALSLWSEGRRGGEGGLCRGPGRAVPGTRLHPWPPPAAL